MSVLRVLIVDDVDQVRQGLWLLLSLSDELKVIGHAGTGLEALALTESKRPDVILMDLEMPVMSGFEAARRIKLEHPECKVIAFSAHDSQWARAQARKNGIDAFLVKGVPVETIIRTILLQKE